MKLRWLGAALLFFSLRLDATIVERLDMDGLVASSHTIVAGTVEVSETRWTPDRRVIVTQTRIRVDESFKGTPGDELVVTTLGGTIDGITLYVAGMPTFEENEEAVVFVEGDGPYRTVVGLAQGKFHIEAGMVANDLSDLEFPGGVSGAGTRMTFEAFREEIRNRINPF